MSFIERFLFKWDIPYFNKYRKYLIYLSVLSLLILIYPEEYKFIWEIWWKILIIIVFSRPLRDILPKIWLLNKFVLLRKELWIICGFFILAHFVWYLIILDISIIDFITANIWWLQQPRMWWLLSTIALIPVLLTSNIISVKKLWRKWKKIQQLTYPFFIFWALHITFVNPEKQIEMIVVTSLLTIFWILAYKKVKLWK